MGRECRKCKEIIPNKVVIKGKQHNLQNRKFCLKCSPFGKHNTKADVDQKSARGGCYSEWSDDEKKKNMLSVLKRGLERKRKLIELAGNKCSQCEYKYRGSERALSFHHRNPDEKLFGLSMNNLWSKKWEVILEEFQKCDMLCLVCHAELEDKIQSEKEFNYRKWLGIV